MEAHRYRTQTLIIGTGLAACTCALKLADAGLEVTMISPTEDVDTGNSNLAQGGIIYSNDVSDHKVFEEDVMIAGHHYNSQNAVRFLTKEGAKPLKEILIDRLGVPFEKNGDDFNFTKEGGHSIARILHCHDYTGRAIMEAMLDEINKHQNIKILTSHTAIDLLTTEHHANLPQYRYQLRNECLGAYVLNSKENTVEIILANHTILATGGIGQVYLHSTNSHFSVGSGISMAQRAAVRLMNADCVQFHPTSLYRIDSKRFLISEAMRGEGGILRNKNGEAFMSKYDPRKELAPRDVVAKAIVSEMLTTGEEFVYLDPSPVKGDISVRFPTIYNHCKNLGIDLTKDMIPVVPSAHYYCGGVLTDTKGRTSLERLFAIGECACTGVHGTNRLASTSLLEALLWGASTAEYISNMPKYKDIFSKKLLDSIPDWENTGSENNDDPALIAQDWASIKHIMWNYVGIVRTKKRVRRAFDDMRDLSSHLHYFYKNTPISNSLIRLFHGCQTAYIITQAALRSTKDD